MGVTLHGALRGEGLGRVAGRVWAQPSTCNLARAVPATARQHNKRTSILDHAQLIRNMFVGVYDWPVLLRAKGASVPYLNDLNSDSSILAQAAAPVESAVDQGLSLFEAFRVAYWTPRY